METYVVNITKSGNGVEISNFGDLMYVPVKATIQGNTFTILSQTFKGKSMTIVIYGQGTFSGNKLTFDYTIKRMMTICWNPPVMLSNSNNK